VAISTSMLREIVEIDEARCDGCGQCVPSCAEGAIRMVNGKARLVGDVLCDGLGACLGECPQGALRVVRREAPAFDEQAVASHLAGLRVEPPPPPAAPRRVALSVVQASPGPSGGCPGSRSRELSPRSPAAVPGCAPAPGATPAQGPAPGASALSHWPVQLELVAPRAPWLAGADLLVAADCVPFAYADFHRDLLAGRRVVVGCPKLDDERSAVARLAEIFRESAPRSVTVARMEVPCCGGITRAVREAIRLSGRDVPCTEATIGVQGERLS
jgi:NAD-dependent dihydropyrimidine dehydrogenase PreA subunit